MDIQTAKDNIGKEVVLNEDTKPYKLSSGAHKAEMSINRITSGSKMVLRRIADDGDALVSTYDENNNITSNQYIAPIHLSLATPTLQEMDELEEPQEPLPTSKLDNNELRLEIFRIAGHSNSLWELKEIEAWLLNK